MMEHKGYAGRVEYDDESGIFHGEVINTRDVITFQDATVAELRKAFRDSVEDYLAFCAERGEERGRCLAPSRRRESGRRPSRSGRNRRWTCSA